jgi:hypothetical protein
VNVFYKLAIPGILGGMGLYIGLELFHELVVRIKRRRQSMSEQEASPSASAPLASEQATSEPSAGDSASSEQGTKGPGRTFTRFNFSQRLEHIVQIFGFVVLCVTGIPQKYNGAAWADSAIALMGGIDLVRGIHRAFAIVLMLELVYHAFAILWALVVKRVRLDDDAAAEGRRKTRCR